MVTWTYRFKNLKLMNNRIKHHVAWDWLFENRRDDEGPVPGDSADAPIDSTKAGTQPKITIPFIDWIAKPGANRADLALLSCKK
jgi:hypothetical protein